jgi:raffinose/stachyose/melibiose transport system substrate-binding protein
MGSGRHLRIAATAVAAVLFALGFGTDARPAAGDTVSITMLGNTQDLMAWQVLIPNFERVYPNITVSVTYATSTNINQLEATEISAGNAPDILAVFPGCGTPISVCLLAKDGDLAPMIGKPWTTRSRSLPLVISYSKYHQALYAFEPGVSLMGVFTNDGLFQKLGLKVPQTFSQLLAVCQKAKTDGTAAVLLPGADSITTEQTVADLAVAAVFGRDTHWLAKLRAGTATFDGSEGRHQALQDFVEMNNAGCFEPGATGTSKADGQAQFAQGQGLMFSGVSSNKAGIDAARPAFGYSFHPFPGETDAGQTETFVNLSQGLGVNARSSPAEQAAAQTFIDFVARPKQNALYAQIRGGLTQYELLKGQVTSFMSAMAAVLESHAYVINPAMLWQNPSVGAALQQGQIGLLTGQSSVDDVLNAMDAAWKQGPS